MPTQRVLPLMDAVFSTPGLAQLQYRTNHGHTAVKVALIDGAADTSCACFQDIAFTVLDPYWQEPITWTQDQMARFTAIDNSTAGASEKSRLLEEAFPDPWLRGNLSGAAHATYTAGVLFGRSGSASPGMIPNCQGINIPLAAGDGQFLPLNLARALHLALDVEVDLILLSLGFPSPVIEVDHILQRALEQCRNAGILIITGSGNDYSRLFSEPAQSPHVLAVGALRQNGHPFQFSNWNAQLADHTILAPGEDIPGPQPGNDQPVLKRGTCAAAAVAAGVAALLMSLQLEHRGQTDGEAVKRAILQGASPITPPDAPTNPQTPAARRLHLPGAVRELFNPTTPLADTPHQDPPEPLMTHASPTPSQQITANCACGGASPPEEPRPTGPHAEHLDLQDPVGVQPSSLGGGQGLVYALGNLGYDFATEARRDAFRQAMSPFESGGVTHPANPYDPRQIVAHLREDISVANQLIWTLNLEQTPIYAVVPDGPFGQNLYLTMLDLLAGEVLGPDQDGHIDRVSMPGRLTGESVRLFSGQVVPVLAPQSRRGIYGWATNELAERAAEMVTSGRKRDRREAVAQTLRAFLDRIYYDFRNLGRTSPDRSLNFAATNLFQAAEAVAAAHDLGLVLDTIQVQKSPYCRMNSDCWDVKIKFFDPENNLRARRVYRFTIDVSDLMPVTIGELRSWAEAR